MRKKIWKKKYLGKKYLEKKNILEFIFPLFSRGGGGGELFDNFGQVITSSHLEKWRIFRGQPTKYQKDLKSKHKFAYSWKAPFFDCAGHFSKHLKKLILGTLLKIWNYLNYFKIRFANTWKNKNFVKIETWNISAFNC